MKVSHNYCTFIYFLAICVFHDRPDNSKFMYFNEESLTKSTELLQLRKKGDFKYNDAELPSAPDNKHGYHLNCWRRFTTLPASLKKEQEKQSQESIKPKRLRSSTNLPATTSTGVFERVCLFCNKKDRKFKGQKQKLSCSSTSNMEKNTRLYATYLGDEEMLLKIREEDFVSKEVVYHGICSTEYKNKYQAMKAQNSAADKQKQTSAWHQSRRIHEEAFQILCLFIEEDIIATHEIHLIADVNSYYKTILAEKFEQRSDEIFYTAQKLEEKLKKHFGERIKVIKGRTKRGSLLFSSALTEEEALRKEHLMQTKLDTKIREVGYLLREEINSLPKKNLPSTFTINDLIKGEVDVPELLLQFFTALICGPDPRQRESERKQRRIKSIAEDVIFASTSGKKIPGKHFQIGLALKSLTGSRKIIEIMNRLGHCINYHAVEEFETELTYSITSQTLSSPDGMKLQKDLCPGVAFDNFDRFCGDSFRKRHSS